MGADPTSTFDQEILWPSVPRSLHDECAWSQTARLGWGRGGAVFRIQGFRDAAELIAAQVGENRSYRNSLIFPFVYCWRQYLELQLKQLIVEAERLRDFTDGLRLASRRSGTSSRVCGRAVGLRSRPSASAKRSSTTSALQSRNSTL